MLPKYNEQFWVGQAVPAVISELPLLTDRIKYNSDHLDELEEPSLDNRSGVLSAQELEELFREPEPKLEQPKEALRFDQGKTNWSLMPFEAVEEINKVLEFGANKYAEWNFVKDGGMNHSRILNSCLRHIFSYMRGEDCDRESGLSHLAHAGCNILFLLYYKKYPEVFTKDDRHVR